MIDNSSIEHIEKLVCDAFPSHNTVCNFWRDDNYVRVMINDELIVLAQETTIERLRWEMEQLAKQAKRYDWDALLKVNTEG